MSRSCTEHGRDKNIYKTSVRKPEEGRPRFRWDNNIRMYLREAGWEVVGWIPLHSG